MIGAEFFAIAAIVWGAPACGAPVTVERPFADADVHPAYTTMDGQPSDKPGYELPPCTIALSPEFAGLPAYARCTLIVHEWGHLSGQKHSADPRNVMYGGGPIREYWRCSERWRARYLAEEQGEQS